MSYYKTTLLSCLFLLSINNIQAQERDIFKPISITNNTSLQEKKEQQLEQKPEQNGIILQGIYNNQKNKFALINGEYYKEKSIINEDNILSKIYPSYIIIYNMKTKERIKLDL